MHDPTSTAIMPLSGRLRRSWRTWLPLAASGVLLATVLGILAAFVAPLGSAATDPGAALRAALVARGATMPAAWATTADANHALICHEYAIGYSNVTAGTVDQWGVTVPMAEAAIAATGFCR